MTTRGIGEMIMRQRSPLRFSLVQRREEFRDRRRSRLRFLPEENMAHAGQLVDARAGDALLDDVGVGVGNQQVGGAGDQQRRRLYLG